MSSFADRLKDLPNLAVDAHCELTLGHESYSIRSDDELIIVNSRGRSSTQQLLSRTRSATKLATVREIAKLLNATGLTVEVRENGQTLFQLGQNARSRLFRLLGVPHFRCASPRLLWSVLT